MDSKVGNFLVLEITERVYSLLNMGELGVRGGEAGVLVGQKKVASAGELWGESFWQLLPPPLLTQEFWSLL
jgi:hypothetical protein